MNALSVRSRSSSLHATWLSLLLVLLVCLPPLMIGLGERLSSSSMESKSLVSAQESWLRWHEGEPGALLVTTNDFRPRFEKPPLVAWLSVLAWSDLDPHQALPVELTYRARLLAVAMGLILVAATFWIGCMLGDRHTAVLAALIAGSMFFLQRQARIASYDIHFSAWGTLAIAAGLWAMGLRAAAPNWGRWAFGWLIAGVVMGCSGLSKNPLSFVIVGLPLIGAIALNPGGANQRRRGLINILGLLLAFAVAAAMIAPWYLYVLEAYKSSRHVLSAEFRQPRDDPQPVWYYLGVLGLVQPWTPWMIGGLVQPFTERAGQTKRLLLVAWVWFVLILVFFSIPEAKQQRYILPIVPAAALLTAQCWRDLQARAEQGDRDPLAMRIGYAQWVVLGVLSLAFGPFLAMQDWLVSVAGAWIERPVVAPIGWPTATVIIIASLAAVVCGWCWQVHGQMMRAAIATAAWALIATSAFWSAYAEAPTRVDELNRQAQRLRAIVGQAPVHSLRVGGREHRSEKLDEEFRFYFGRLIRHITPQQLVNEGGDGSRIYVLARPGEAYEAPLRDAGYRLVDHVRTDEAEVQELWVRDDAIAQQ